MDLPALFIEGWLYDREASVCCCVKWAPGDVGDGIPGDAWEPLFIDAVRCEDAAMAAAEGSSVLPSLYARPSWLECGGMCVGDVFLGVDPPAYVRLDTEREMPEPPLSRTVKLADGDARGPLS